MFRLLLLAVAVLMLSGCDNRPERIPVSGQVLIDGEPLKLGKITLVPKGARPSMGTLDENGRFVLRCYDSDDGVIPGTHRVAIVANKGVGDTGMKWFAPKKYADFKTSGLEVTINEETTVLKIDLTWDGGKPFSEGTVNADDSMEGD